MYLGSLSKIRLERRRKGGKRINNFVSWAGITHSPVVRSWECSAHGKYWDLFWSECAAAQNLGKKILQPLDFSVCALQNALPKPSLSQSPELLNPRAELEFFPLEKGRTKFFLPVPHRAWKFQLNQNPQPVWSSCFNHLENGCSKRLQWANNSELC